MGRIVTTSLESDKVLQGEIYCFSNFYNLIDLASQEVLLVTSTTRAVALTASVTVQGDATVEFFEDTTTSDNGSVQVLHNANRTYEDNSSLSLFETPTVTDDGTDLGSIAIPAGTKKDAIGFDLDFGGGFILKQGTKYLFRITNESEATRDFSIAFTWFDNK